MEKPQLKIRKLPPCRAACPAHVNVQAYVSLIQRGKFREAVEIIRKDLPFPAICGRVCFSPCEDACARVNVDQSVAIRGLKRLVADIEREQGRVKGEPVPKKYSEKVAIIGAGPAGLTAAYELAKMGYPVTVFERMPEPGGMMRYGIPNFRLEKFVVANEIAYIQDIGVEIKTGVEFGKDITLEGLREEGYKAFFIAIGAQLGMKLNVPGEDLEGVISAVDFLRALATGKPLRVGERVAVIGGGNTAMDAARTAKKLGAKEVIVLYRRSREEMPAHPHEVELAEKDGVKFYFLVAPKRIIGENGKVKAIECIRMRLSEPDESGRRRPVPISFSEHQYEVDMVIPAIGQVVETSALPQELLNKDKGGMLIKYDPQTLETRIPGVFVGGDLATGPASIIEAVGAGKRAAISIHLYLRGRDPKEGLDETIEEVTWVKDWNMVNKKARRYDAPIEKPHLSLEEAMEYLMQLKKKARFEAFRCLGCGPCAECLAGVELCEGDKAVVDEVKCVGCNVCAVICPVGAIKKNDRGVAQVNEDLCKGCGLCAARCPENAIAMRKLSAEAIMAMISTALER
ncbi:MAG: FAD-dependent oxidoreductase [Candidatus Bathyarchaeota archaeon]|nr:FAD-dependent oxidoreductase [Candidatus Bathyarchaeota archaeon]MCX8177620.1 FAD-dependent oxidoreductase [Candidatus Bathyarchaeota archaeon]MDW8193877.1 FAD-dependent oxidoreductase [Nitrososphaerota archaeon]